QKSQRPPPPPKADSMRPSRVSSSLRSPRHVRSRAATDKPLIIFVGSVYPSQHSLLCSYLRASGMADAWFMTTPGHKARHEKECDHLLSFQPDGPIVGPQSYYYSSKVERSARICKGVLQALKAFEKAQGRHIDVVVAHSLWGAPNWLYDELQAAIVSY